MRSAVDIVLTTAAPDDAGARTADLFDWQAAVAAADVLTLALADLTDRNDGRSPPLRRVVCEHHEDWLVLEDSTVELVSAKHRELSSGAWTTLRQLATDGGLAHLFMRWRGLGKGCRCRMVTNAGLAAGKPRALQRACSALAATRRGETVAQDALDAAELLLQEMAVEFVPLGPSLRLDPTEWVPPNTSRADVPPVPGLLVDVRGFLSVLVLDVERPFRGLMHASAPELYVEPLLEALGERSDLVRAIWRAVHSLCGVRMRVRGRRSGGELAALQTIANDTSSGKAQRRRLEARTITAEAVMVAVDVAISDPNAHAVHTRVPYTPGLALELDRR